MQNTKHSFSLTRRLLSYEGDADVMDLSLLLFLKSTTNTAACIGLFKAAMLAMLEDDSDEHDQVVTFKVNVARLQLQDV